MTTNCPSFVRHQSLEATQVIPLFDSTTTTFTSTPPFKPKAGEVYVMKLDIGHESKFAIPMNTFLHPLDSKILMSKLWNYVGNKTKVYYG
jgi:hypothetical protein